ncbi:MAG TPA: beta-propeller fold lactonase family protein [Acidimicrobiales bacterium]|nr:beta-propeller fold lactonase family protein [Acidimicrobiales bacterium]
MRKLVHIAAGVGAALGVSAFAPLAAAAAQGAAGGSGADHVVFVQTDALAGNQVVAYDRANDGTLTWSATYDTGGQGGQLNGSLVDHLASQGSLTYDAAAGLLYAVNAGSNTVSVFAVDGDRLVLRQVVDAGGTFPVSVATSGTLAYVLNAGGQGSISGFRVVGGRLHPIEGSTRSLGLTIPTDTNQFTHAPGQVAFTPDGSQLVVTTKASSNAIDIFAVDRNGRVSAAPVVNSEPGTVPFAVTFDPSGHLLVAEVGTNALASFSLGVDGTATLLDAVGTSQAATCWVASAQGYFFTSNAGSPSLSGFEAAPNGQLTDLGNTITDPGTVDASASSGGQFLYVQTGKNGIVDEFAVNTNGSLSEVGSVTVPGAAGGEGIVAN